MVAADEDTAMSYSTQPYNRSGNKNNYPHTNTTTTEQQSFDSLMYRSQGLLAVYKPLEWTSQDVVSYIRGILDRDAKGRGIQTAKIGSRSKAAKQRIIRVGHGGTLGT
jgi:tRNA U55 pseudouridine synthase TruB